MDKLGLRTTAELTRYAFQSGLLAAEEPLHSSNRASNTRHAR
jgi:hypothetical protein